MADKDKKKDEKEETDIPEGSGSKKKIILLAVIGLVLIGISVGGTLFAINLLSGEDETEMLEGEGSVDEEIDDKEAFLNENDVEAAGGPAIYYPMKPAIIVNFQDRGRQRFLQAELTLMLRDESMISAIETHMPMLRNSMVMLFGGQTYSELQTPEGKDFLQEQALEEIQEILEDETGRAGIEKVLFTSFVMQ